MHQADVDAAASALLTARRTMTCLDTFPTGAGPDSLADAYAIQDRLQELGKWRSTVLKVGCTSDLARQALLVDRPIAGRVPGPMTFESPAVLSSALFHHPPLLEAEFALRTAVPLAPDDETTRLVNDLDWLADVALDAVAPAIELVDTRWGAHMGAGGPWLVADNSVAGGVVLGEAVGTDQVPIRSLTDVEVILSVDGAVAASGSGESVLGGPVASVAFSLGHELDRGRTVDAGTWIITGTCTGLTPIASGASATASFAGIGDVAVNLDD